VSPSNVYNRGCKSQNGASCLANQGWGYQDILKFYYGMDIGFEQATGACVAPTECTPGAQETQGCERCGTRTRTCDGSGAWGPWGPCEQQGECEPGDEQEQACGDCGLQHRVCTNQCVWGSWSDCTSEDVSGPCDTGEPGRCADGELRCVDGLLVCEPLLGSELERCDGLDNDCNGEVDEGIPPVLGEPPPALAAQLDLLTAPTRLEPGSQDVVELRVTNLGTRDWAAGEIELRAGTVQGGGASALYVEGGWQSPEVVLTLDEPLPASQAAVLRFLVTLQSGVNESRQQTFWLHESAGEPVPCPAPVVTLEITPDGTVETGRPDAGPNVEPSEVARSGCGCAGATSRSALGVSGAGGAGGAASAPGAAGAAGAPGGPGSGGAPLFGLLLLLWLLFGRTRAHRSGRTPPPEHTPRR
jgi:hypothetical protein